MPISPRFPSFATVCFSFVSLKAADLYGCFFTSWSFSALFLQLPSSTHCPCITQVLWFSCSCTSNFMSSLVLPSFHHTLQFLPDVNCCSHWHFQSSGFLSQEFYLLHTYVQIGYAYVTSIRNKLQKKTIWVWVFSGWNVTVEISVTLFCASHCVCLQLFQEVMPCFIFSTAMYTDCLWRKKIPLTLAGNAVT